MYVYPRKKSVTRSLIVPEDMTSLLFATRSRAILNKGVAVIFVGKPHSEPHVSALLEWN